MRALELGVVRALRRIFPPPRPPVSSAPPSLRQLSLIEMDERGYGGVWVESSADRSNQGGSFTQCEPINPRG